MSEWTRQKELEASQLQDMDFGEAFKIALDAARSHGKREAILTPAGKPVFTSRNLAGIQRAISRDSVKSVQIDRFPDRFPRGEGRLRVLFENGNRYETEFASYEVLKTWIHGRSWLQGIPIKAVEGRGVISKKFP
jgi:hypothetical protein